MKPEAQLRLAIRRGLESLGFFVSDLEQNRPTRVTPGIPDLFVMDPIEGGDFWVEVKTPKGRVSAAQKGWHAVARKAGTTVIVARSVGDVVDYVKKTRKRIS